MFAKTTTRWLCSTAMLAAPLMAHAIDGITDTAHDFLPTFAGSTASTDLDVISANVLYDAGSNLFQLTATMAGAIGLTPTGFYVWGVNRGAGTAGFAANGISGVRFDTVVLLRPGGASTAGGVPLAASAITVAGNTITAVVSGTVLPGTGFANKLDYTWNLWPRDGAFAGFAAISDFAPDNANFSSTAGTVVAVPEPQTLALLLGGLGVVALTARRRRA
jgi:hypothetical protein